jgi:hypothetical protein
MLIEVKKEGRKRKLDEQQKGIATRDKIFTALIDYICIAASSGGLAKPNIFEIVEGLLV